MTQTTNAYLMRVLDAFHRSRGQPRRLERARHHRGEALRFVKGHFPRSAARAGEPFATGGEEAGIVVPFQAGFAGTARQAKAILFDAAQAEFQRLGVHVKDERIAIELGFLQGAKTLKIDLIPGMEPRHGAYDEEDEEEATKVLVLFDRRRDQDVLVNLHRQRRILGEQGELLRIPIRLLKIWKFHAGIAWSALALEALVVEAFTKPFTGEQTPGRLLIHVLTTLRQKLSAGEGEGELWREILPIGGEETFPRQFRGMLRALEQKDLEEVKKYFPMLQ